jgi:hypothetical protein
MDAFGMHVSSRLKYTFSVLFSWDWRKYALRCDVNKPVRWFADRRVKTIISQADLLLSTYKARELLIQQGEFTIYTAFHLYMQSNR